MSRRTRYAVLATLATAAIAGGVLAGATAGPPESPNLSNVATANTRSDGYAPASKLSVELLQTAVAQGSTKVENCYLFQGHEGGTPGYITRVNLAGSLGNAAYEGIQNDKAGNLWLAEDVPAGDGS